MTYANFKDQVVSYMNRAAAAVVTVGAQDLVLLAMNDVRRQAQRDYTFEGLSTQAFVSLSMVPKSMLTDFKTTPALSTTIVAKRVDALYEYGTATVGATTVYYPTQQIELRRRNALKSHIPSDPTATALSTPALSQFAYIQGTTIAHTNLTTATTVLADIIEFMGDHAGASVEDIWLTYYTDWLKWATLAQLNLWLKDKERTPVDLELTGRLWEGVKRHDAQQALSVDDLSLD
jgi:hypothetical protein